MTLPEKWLPSYTYEDYVKWEGDWELIEGIPYAIASPLGKHQRILTLLLYLLTSQLRECPANCFAYPELDWIINEKTVVRPDISVTCYDVEDYIRSRPEVVFEIVSRSSFQKDEEIKFHLFERERVPHYVLVYPDIRKVRVYKLVNSKYQLYFDGDREEVEISINEKCRIRLKAKTLWE